MNFQSKQFKLLRRVLWFLAVCAWMPTAAHGQILSFSPEGQKRLAALVTADPDAASLFKTLTRIADAALKETPQPVPQISTEGRLETDPIAQQTRAALQDMKKIYALGQCFQVTGRDEYKQAAAKFMLAWATTMQPTGNPIDATHLDELIETYDMVRAKLGREEKQTIDAWLEQIARQQIGDWSPTASSGSNNWHSHRLKLVGLIGFVIQSRQFVQVALSGFPQQIGADLQPDGSSFDFHERDSLHYHCYTLEPLLTLAIAAQQRGATGLYTYVAPNGASLEKSVAFLVPFAEGKQTHAEFVNSNVEFDRRRAAAGQKNYQAGRPFEPTETRYALALASFFDPKLEGVVNKLLEKAGTRQTKTWQLVLNEVGRQERPAKTTTPRRPVRAKKPTATSKTKARD